MNLKGTKKKNQVVVANIFEQQEMIAKAELIRKDLKAFTWHELETNGKFDKNAKLTFISDDMLILGCDVGSETHYLRAIDTRGRELSKSAFPFSNSSEGFQSAKEWTLKIAAENSKDQIVMGLEPTGHYWYALTSWMISNGISVVQVNPYAVKQTKEVEDNSQLNSESYISGKEFLISLIRQLPKPLTIVQESYHIDRSFRDMYYMYFSNQHFQVKRYSRRLSFFLGAFDAETYYAEDYETGLGLREAFIGACVINPLVSGAIGRTLISPKYVLNTGEKPAYMRLSAFDLHVYGRHFTVRAFPYRMQDEETMCCAEVTLLNLLEYYANSYIDYKIVVPSDIINQE